MELKSSKTEKNLRDAVSGEAQAAILYEFFAKKAKKEGLEEIADVFRETAANEKAHAEIYLKLLQCISTTGENLASAAMAEHHEHTKMYPEFSTVARSEGFADIADTFERVGQIESEHEERFRRFQCQLSNGSLYSKGVKVTWICKNCGHRHHGDEAPKICPVCKHPVGYFSQIRESV